MSIQGAFSPAVFVGAFFIGFSPAAAAPGALDPAFDANLTASEVFATVVQPDGKILLGGDFTAVRGTACGYFARLNADGTLESSTTFNPGSGADARVNSIAVQYDGKLLIAGDFTSVNGQARSRIARLLANGTVESTATFNAGTGANGRVRSVTLQPDGKILLTGEFTTINGQSCNRIARLNPDGSLESSATFNPGTGANNAVYSAYPYPDGRILIWGAFTNYNGQSRNRYARLTANGALESTATFNPGSGANDGVWCATVQADGRILLGGLFSTVNGSSRSCMARLLDNGTVESPAGSGFSSTVRSIVVQADGGIMASGLFSSVSGQSRSRIARLLPSGSVEGLATFDPGTGASSNVSGIALQPDGKIVMGGMFTSVGGAARNYSARLLNDPVVETLTVTGQAKVQWMRSGAAGEIPAALFEWSADGTGNWSPLGSGTRISGGWELAGLNLPSTGKVRARGRVAGGYHNGSGSFVETVAAYGASPLALWRELHFGTTAATGPAANDADPDHDGLENLVEYAFALNPNASDAAGLPVWQKDDDNYLLTFSRPAGVTGVTYAAEYSNSLAPDGWTAAANAGANSNFVFFVTAAEARLYLRLRVILQ